MPAGSLSASAACGDLASATAPVAAPKDFATKLRRPTASAEALESANAARTKRSMLKAISVERLALSSQLSGSS
jgi:hypothetical protein